MEAIKQYKFAEISEKEILKFKDFALKTIKANLKPQSKEWDEAFELAYKMLEFQRNLKDYDTIH